MVSIETKRGENDYCRPSAGVAGSQEAFPGRHREANRAAAVLHIAGGKRPYGSRHRDLGETGAGSRSTAVPTFLRRRRTAPAAQNSETETLKRSFVGEFRQAGRLSP